MRRLIAMLLIVLGSARGADALSVQDLMELSRAGLGDEVLLALIEVNRGVFAIDPDTLRALKEAGVSDRVIAALIRSGRELPVPDPWWAEEPPAAAPQPPVVVIEHHAAAEVQHVAVPVPVYVPVPATPWRHRPVARTPIEWPYVPFQTGPPPSRPSTPPTPLRPVYWGFGGELRPDAWKPAGHEPDPRKSGRPSGPKAPRQD